MSATLTPADVPSRARREGPWYRRPAWWLVGAILAIVVVAVVLDLPTSASPAGRRADLRSLLVTVKGDVGQCSGGFADAVTAYRDAGAGRLSHATAATYTTQAIAACSFTNGGVVDLGGVEAPRSLASLHLEGLAPSVDAWAYLDAFTALQDLRRVEANPSAAAPLAAFNHDVARADQHRAAIERQVTAAERRLGMKGAPLGLAAVTPLG